jgi:hypothetical protein
MAAFARPALLAAADDLARRWVRTTIRQLQIATWLAGAAATRQLDGTALQARRDPTQWVVATRVTVP